MIAKLLSAELPIAFYTFLGWRVSVSMHPIKTSPEPPDGWPRDVWPEDLVGMMAINNGHKEHMVPLSALGVWQLRN
jgi:hypothetical protein